MELKKNPKVDLSRRTGLFFAIGLAIATSISLFAINYRTYESDKGKVQFSAVDDKLDEEVEEIVVDNTPPPPPPPPEVTLPEEIEVVDNKVEIKTDFASTETTKEEVIAEAPKIETPVEDDIPDEIPFAIIEDKPTTEACKGLPKGKQEDCFKKTLDSHVQKHFRYPEIAQEMGIQGRVHVSFRINKDGSVSVIGARGPDKSLEAEARRIIEKLPNFIPGRQRGKAVAVTYSYPIFFKLSN